MGMADIAEVLWNGHLRHNPANPAWPDRDRFVVSNGHGSMLVYALLHLAGYDLPMAELESFRQLHSRTPGHPEYRLTPGVETTTGPLGQGLANAVGMAIVERGARGPLQPAGARGGRSSHLGLRGRRVPDGGDLARGLLPRGDARARQAHRVLRRQRRLHRRRRGGLVHRRHPGPLRGIWLAGGARRGRPRRGGGGGGDRGGPRRRRAAEPHLLPDHHRVGGPDQGGHRGCPRRPARSGRGGGGAGGDGLDASPLRGAGCGARGVGCARLRRPARGRVAPAHGRLSGGLAGARGGARAASSRRPSRRLDERERGRDRRD